MKKKLTVEGMSCMHCVKHIHDAIMVLPGVTAVDIDIQTKTAFVNSDGTVKNNEIKEIVSQVGYEITEIEKV